MGDIKKINKQLDELNQSIKEIKIIINKIADSNKKLIDYVVTSETLNDIVKKEWEGAGR